MFQAAFAIEWASAAQQQAEWKGFTGRADVLDHLGLRREGLVGLVVQVQVQHKPGTGGKDLWR